MNTRFAVSFTALGALMGAMAPTLHAQECASDGDCPHGFACEITGGTTCASPACRPGQDCPPPPPCENTVYRECRPGPCSSDMDCATGMVCHSESIGVCGGAAAAPCPEGMSCPAPQPPECETQTRQYCVPRYVLPCTEDRDCGAGFTCQAQEVCACSGSGGTGVATPAVDPASPVPSVDGGSAMNAEAPAFRAPTPEPIDADGGAAQPKPAADAGVDEGVSDEPPPADGGSTTTCTCRESDVKSCVLQEVPCDSATDCPPEFSCEEDASGSDDADIACDPIPSSAADGGMANCQSGAAPSIAPSAAKYCRPPYADVFGSGSKREDANAAVEQGDATSGPTTPTTTAPPTSEPRPDADATDAGAVAPTTHVRACSIANPGASSGGTLMGGLGMLLLGAPLWRRRRRGV